MWSYGSWIYNYLSPLTLWIQIPLRQGVLDTTSCDKVCQWLFGRLVVSSTNKTDRHDMAEILLTVALNTITITIANYISFSKWLIKQDFSCIGYLLNGKRITENNTTCMRIWRVRFENIFGESFICSMYEFKSDSVFYFILFNATI